jgi:hypothetical protein
MDVSVFIYLFSSLLNDAFVTRYSVEWLNDVKWSYRGVI